MAVIVYKDREMDNTTGGVYTEYLTEQGDSTSNLPTDCRAGSLAYSLEGNTLYMFGADQEWAVVGGGSAPASGGESGETEQEEQK